MAARSPTEAGVIAVAYALFLGLVFYREYSWRALWPALRESAVESALVGLLIGAAAPFAWILIAEQIPQKFVELTLTMIESSWAILLLLNALMLVAGMFLSLTASMLILVPIFLPLMLKIGVDPVHFGIIVVVTLMIGGLTPPVGYLVFITSSITKTPTHLVFRECAPFIAALVAGLALITYIPAISMGLVWLSQ